MLLMLDDIPGEKAASAALNAFEHDVSAAFNKCLTAIRESGDGAKLSFDDIVLRITQREQAVVIWRLTAHEMGLTWAEARTSEPYKEEVNKRLKDANLLFPAYVLSVVPHQKENG